MMSFIGYIFTFFVAIGGKTYHPVHVSILNVEVNSSKHTIDLSMKLYTADLELAVAHNYNIAMGLGKSTEIATSTALLQRYFSSKLVVTVNNRPCGPLLIKSKEKDEDATRLFFSIPVKEKLKALYIQDRVLMDVFEDQTNLVIVLLNGKEQGFRQTLSSVPITLKI